MKIFDHLNNLTKNKVFPDFELEEVHKSYDIYMVNRFLSMFDAFIPIIELVNQNKLSKEMHYRFLFNMLPKINLNFSNYLKKKKNEIEDERRQLLLKYFGFGSRDLDDALTILTEKQIESICKKYDFGKVR